MAWITPLSKRILFLFLFATIICYHIESFLLTTQQRTAGSCSPSWKKTNPVLFQVAFDYDSYDHSPLKQPAEVSNSTSAGEDVVLMDVDTITAASAAAAVSMLSMAAATVAEGKEQLASHHTTAEAQKRFSEKTSAFQSVVIEEESITAIARTEPKGSLFSSLFGEISNVNKARILLLGSAALYGTNFSLVKFMGETDMSVGLSTTLRFGFAALTTFPWLIQVNKPSRTNSKQHLPDPRNWQDSWNRFTNPSSIEFQSAISGLEVGMWNSIGYVAQAVGLETTPASESAFLCSMAVVIVPLLDFLAGKKMQQKQIIGVILAVIGVAFLELGGPPDPDAVTSSMSFMDRIESLQYGDFCSLIQPLAFGIGFWRMERAMHRFPNQAMRTTAGQLLAVFFGSSLYLAVTAINDTSNTILPTIPQLQEWLTDPVILFNLFWTGVITTALTIYMETLALKTLSAAETTLIFCTEPLWGTAFAMVFFDERLGIGGAGGAIFILLGCLFANLGFDGLKRFVPSFLFPRQHANTSVRVKAAPAATPTSVPSSSYLRRPVVTSANTHHFLQNHVMQDVVTPYAGICTSLFARLQTGSSTFLSDTALNTSVAPGTSTSAHNIHEIEQFLEQVAQVTAHSSQDILF